MNTVGCAANELAFPTPPDTVERAEDAEVAVDAVEWLTFHEHMHVSVFIEEEPTRGPG